MVKYMLSTLDNPYNPFHQFDEWNAWDMQMGYHTLSYLARIALTSDDLSDVEQDEVMRDSIDEIVRENVLGIYYKVAPSTDTRARASLSSTSRTA